MSHADLIVRVVLYGVIPLWLLAGLLDWYLHRRSAIENTSGLRESVLPALMLIEVGLPALAALLLEINAGVLLFGLAALMLHEATTMADLRWANHRREISPLEQHIHSILELLPIFVLVLLSIVYRDQWLALLAGDGDFALRWKDPPLPLAYLSAVFTAIVLLQVMPYAEELLRCRRAARGGRET